MFALTATEADAIGLDIGKLTRVTVGNEECFVGVAADVWVEIELGRGWLAAYRITPSRPSGYAAIGELRILPSDGLPSRPGTWSAEFKGTAAVCPPSGINARVLKAIRLGKLVPAINELLLGMAKYRNLKGGPDALRWSTEIFEPFKAPTLAKPRKTKASAAGRPRSITDQELARIAQAYRAALDRSEPNAADSIARRFGLRDADNVRMRVLRDAKKRGLIATAGGRAWKLTAEAEALANAKQQTPKARSDGKKTRTR